MSLVAPLVERLMPHLIVLPILLPMATAALMLLLGDTRRPLKALVNVLSCLVGLGLSIALVYWVLRMGGPQAVGVYLPSNWPVPYGIVLVVDRLSAMMLLLTSVLALASVLYAIARWDKAGVHFHPLFQLQLMGLAGAFLTADLFNLFVFFEIMLTASYGLLLHGSGWARVRSGLHYIAMNLMASTLFLIGVAIVYGAVGTLNMADIAQKLARLPTSERDLVRAGAGILAVAFLIKAAMWPLGFWLVPAYSAASAPVAGLFAIMTKVGLYSVLRLWTLAFPAQADDTPLFGATWLIWGGLATMAVGTLGLFGSMRLVRTACWAVVVSSGTTLAAFGLGGVALTTAAIYYILSSAIAASALMLIVEPIERSRTALTQVPRSDDDGDPFPSFYDMPEWQAQFERVNLDDNEEALVGRPLQRALVFLGLAFIACVLMVAGLPPLAGFLAKVMMIEALLQPGSMGNGAATVPVAAWVFIALLIVSGLAAMVGLTRIGVRILWAPQGRPAPRLSVLEGAPVIALVVLGLLLVIRASPVVEHARMTADWLYDPQRYISAVMSARPVPSPSDRSSHASPSASVPPDVGLLAGPGSGPASPLTLLPVPVETSASTPGSAPPAPPGGGAR